MNQKYKEQECERVISLLDRPTDHSGPCWGKGRLALQHEVSQRSEDAPQFEHQIPKKKFFLKYMMVLVN